MMAAWESVPATVFISAYSRLYGSVPGSLQWRRCLIAVAAHWLYRYRLNQLLAVERVRHRLASDLHDDLGAGLAEIAITQ